MSSDEFWKDDPQLFVSYRTSFINKKKREMDELDYKCWLQGLYVHDGNGKLFRSMKQMLHNILASFTHGQQDNEKIDTYPMKPYNELQKEELKKEEKIKDKEEELKNTLICQGSIKQIYREKLKRQTKGSDNI